MKFFSPILLVLWAFTLVSAAPAPAPETSHAVEPKDEKPPKPFCYSEAIGYMFIIPTAHRYTITVNNMPKDVNFDEVCETLWRKLRHYGTECVPDQTTEYYLDHCGRTSTPGELKWQFETGAWCNKGMVSAAWWQATHNKWGGINGCGPIGLLPGVSE